MSERGIFITFEGPEGSGKSTQVKLLVEKLLEKGVDVVCVREPGGTPTGEAIRGLLQHHASGEPIAPTTEVLLFAASRAQLVSHRILPTLEAGTWVISDRFADSTTAYQGYGRGFDVEAMLDINSFAVQGLVPDYTFLLDLPVEEGLERITRRSEITEKALDRIESEAISFHQRVREGYLQLAQRYKDRFTVVDALQEPEVMGASIWERVEGARVH